MLKHFDAALSSGSRVQSLDPLAALAEGFLDVLAVLILQPGRTPPVIGSSDGASAVDAITLDRAMAAPETDLSGLYADSLKVYGLNIDAPAPFASVLKLRARRDGVEYSCVLFPHASGVSLGKLRQFDRAVRRHITEHRLLERYRNDLKRYVQQFDTIQRTAKIGVWGESEAGEAPVWSDGIHRIYDTTPGGEVPRNHLNAFPEPGRAELMNALAQTRASGTTTDLTLPFRTARHQHRTVRVIANALPQLTGPARLAGTMQDVTALTEATEKLWWSANHDALTRLPNRALFGDRFRKALERHARTKSIVALLLVDVDKFKEVNDSLGHPAGDELLVRVAESLKAAVRTKDTVARTGGDEFSILMEDFESLSTLHGVLDRLAKSLQIRLVWGRAVMEVSLSVGVAAAPFHGVQQSDLTSAADAALYRMKAIDGPALALSDVANAPAEVTRERLVANARSALDAGQISPFFQPQIALDTGRIVAVEALARWQIRTGQTLSAADFADALDDDELGPHITSHLTAEAIAALAAFNRRCGAHITLSVNATSLPILEGGLFQSIVTACDTAEVERSTVTVEISQRLIEPFATVGSRLTAELHDAASAGIGLSLVSDDVRKSPIAAVRHLPFREIKVQQHDVASLSTDLGLKDAVADIVELAQSMGVRVVFEGIETHEQAALVAHLGGAVGQGHYFGAAVPLEELADIVEREQEPRREQQTASAAAR